MHRTMPLSGRKNVGILGFLGRKVSTAFLNTPRRWNISDVLDLSSLTKMRILARGGRADKYRGGHVTISLSFGSLREFREFRVSGLFRRSQLQRLILPRTSSNDRSDTSRTRHGVPKDSGIQIRIKEKLSTSPRTARLLCSCKVVKA